MALITWKAPTEPDFNIILAPKNEKMKKIFFLILVHFTTLAATAQINTNLILVPTPPATLSEWANRREVLTYIITGQQGVNFRVIIKIEIKTTDGTVIATNDLAKAKVFTLSSATTVLFAADVLPLDNITFTGKFKTSLERTGKLPSDNYILCVQLLRPVDFTAVSEIRCKNFYLAATQLPILIKPYNEEVLDAKIAQTAITFRWTPVVPRLTEPVTYRLQVFEVLNHQNAVQALRSNQPLLDKEIKAATQYIWRPQLSFLREANIELPKMNEKELNTITPNEKMMKNTAHQKFIWTIQSLDKDRKPITQTDGNGEGRSEPVIFFVNTKSLNSINKVADNLDK